MTLDTPPESASSPDGEAPDVEKLIATLLEKGFADLFADPEIRSYCLRGLRDAGCPPPTHHVAFYCLTKLVSGTGRFAEQALRNRLVQIAKKWPKVRAFLNRLVSIDVSKENAVALKKQLLADMGRAPTAEEMQADETQALEVVIALHNRRMISGLSHDIRQHYSYIREELQGVCDAIDDAFARFTDVIPEWDPNGPGRPGQNAIRYDAETFDFLGRDDEMDWLKQFLAKPDMAGVANKFRWLLITGDGGVGKTRLAYEFHKSLQSGVWLSGQLDRAQLEKIVQDYKWKPRRPTLMVIDYPAQFPGTVHDFLLYLKKAANQFEFPVRVLLLERDAVGEWFTTVTGGSDPTLKGAIWLPDQHETGWSLPPVPLEAIIEIMGNRFEAAGFNSPSPQLLLKSAFQVDPRGLETENGIVPLPRPLFAAAVAELGIERLKEGAANDESLFEGLDRETVLSEILERERRQKWRDEPDTIPADFEPHENLLALATLCRGLPRKVLAGLDPALKAILPGRGLGFECTINNERLRKMGSRYPDDTVEGLEPDILGGYFLFEILNRLALDGLDQPLLAAAFNQTDDATYTAFLAFRDFPQKFLAITGFFPGQEAEVDAARRYARLGVDLTSGDPVEQTDGVVDRFFHHLDDLQATHSRDREIALEEAKAAVNVTNHAGKAGDWTRVDDMLYRLDALRATFSDVSEIALEEAKAAVNVTNHAGEAGDWSRVDSVMDRLDAVRAKFSDDSEIALEEAKAAFNVTNGAFKAGDWTRVDSMLHRLDALRAKFSDNSEIALLEAKAAFNVTNGALKAGDWTRVDDVLYRLAAVRATFSDNSEIALEEAKAAVNVTNHAGKAGDWTRFDDMLYRLDALRATFPKDREIALQEAMAAVNVIYHAGEAGDWTRVDSMLHRLDALRATFSDNSEIALEEATAAFNVTYHAGQAGDWTRVDSMLHRLDALRATFSDNTEIALEEAKAAVNVTIDAGKAGDWTRVEAMLKRCAVLFERFPDEGPIAVRVLKAVRSMFIDRRRTEALHRDWLAVPATLAAQAIPVAFREDAQEVAIGLMLVKASHPFLTEDADFMAVFDALTEAGVDWDQVKDIPPPPA